MPERGGYRLQEEIASENGDDISVSTARPQRKFTRRHFLELMGAAGASVALGSKIGKEAANGEGFAEAPRSGNHDVEPIKAPRPEPPDNLPVEPLSPQQGETEPFDEASAGEGAGVRKKKNKKEKKRAPHTEKDKKKKQEIKEFWERLHAPEAGAVHEELKRLAKKMENKDRRAEVLELIDTIYNFEDKEVVRARLGGIVDGKYARNYFKVLLGKPETFMPVLSTVANQHGVPLSIMISVFSVEGAGLQASKNRFQLGPDTARNLGLVVETEGGDPKKHVDERTNLKKSAHAAARYLKNLYHAFGNQWGLALSAYNAGSHGLATMITRYFKDAEYTRTGHGPYFAEKDLARLGINSATLYEKERADLLKEDKKKRKALRAIWYPFAAEALGQHGWRLLDKQQAEKRKSVVHKSR